MKKLFKDALDVLKIELNDSQIEQFFLYKDLLLEWNEKINLTAITQDRDIILKHFIDSIAVLNLRDFKNKTVIDVGTGAGFPGLPIKIATPEANITLMDSLNKRINFLNDVSDKLNLQKIECFHYRAEDASREAMFREKFDICVSRAVANLASLSELCIPFIKVGGEFIALKGPDAEREINEAKNAIKTLGCEILDVKSVFIPFTDLNHNIIFIKKIRQTPSKYPRKATKISKNPII